MILQDYPNLVVYLNSLSNKLYSQFEWTGKIKDLEKLI